MDYLGRSIKSQMKYADKYNAKYTLILGDDELKQGLITVKNMATGSQEKKGLDELIEYIKGNLEKQKS
jgi:histidyl-tRNA synthetase